MSDYKVLNKCLCCGGNEFRLALNLNSQPLANSYLTSFLEEEKAYPLAINYCLNCTHVQLTHAVDPDLLFKHYLYVSGTTKTLKEYFDWFVSYTSKFTEGKKILDIACNDGTQLDYYKAKNYITYGIDPAVNLYEKSSVNHNVICDYLTDKSLDQFNTKFNIITAQNVFAHNSYPLEFLTLCKKYLEKDGYIFIQTSQADMILNNQFDTIYHEHISFFSVKSFATLAERAGLNLVDVIRTPVHGVSFVFVLSNGSKDNSKLLCSKESEITLDTIKHYSHNCNRLVSELVNKIKQLQKEKIKVVGYGAAAKGNTLLNYSKIYLDYIVDDNPLKHYLFTPGSRIGIYPPEVLYEERDNVCVIPLAWNFFEEIKYKVQSNRNSKTMFLKYYPTMEIINA